MHIFGEIYDNRVEDGVQITTFDIPAMSERVVKVRARGNARLKGMNSPQIVSVETVGGGNIPGSTVYRVTVRSES